jgi:hypothetical protein
MSKVDAGGPTPVLPMTKGTYPEPWLPGSLKYVYRFFLGRPMDNIIRTNATFFTPATAGYPSRWLRMAGWKRLSVRLSAVYGVVLVLAMLVGWGVRAGAEALGMRFPAWAASLHPARVLVAHTLVIIFTVAPMIIYRLVRAYGMSLPVPVVGIRRSALPGRRLPRVRVTWEGWVRWEVEGRREWDRRYTRPLALAVDAVLGTNHHPRRASKWVTIPRTYREPGHPVVIQLPAGFTGADRGTQDRLTRTVAARLGIKDPVTTWQLEGDQPRVLVAAPVTPPRLVTWEDVERYYLQSEEYRPFLGMTGKDTALYAEMVSDSPHIGLSAGSGAGKSELVKTIIMQALRWGWGVVILDWKEVSQEWAEGLPGVRIVREVPDIHDWLVLLGEDLDDRKRAYRKDRTLPGRAKVLVVYEEMNATSELLSAYWADLRATEDDPEIKRTMPTKSPALRAQNALVFGGRQFGIHCLFMAQRFSNRVTQGNTDIRENFQIKLLSRYSPATVKMLAPDIKPFPKKPTTLGAWVAVMGQDAVVFQAPLISDEEARNYAMGGQENPSHPLTTSYMTPMTQRTGRDSALGEPLGHDPTRAVAGSLALAGDVLPRIDARKLSDMVEELAPLGVTLDVMRNAIKRGEGFPEAVGGSTNRGLEYDFFQVREWARKRHARMQAERRAA